MIRSYAARKYLPARRVFRTSRGASYGAENVFLVVEQDGMLGYGEASPIRYYGETAEDVHLRLLGFADFLKRQTLRSFEDIPRIWKQVERILRPSRAALCAVDVALWDLWSKLEHTSVTELLWKEPARPLITAVTLSVSGPEEMDDRIEEVSGFPLVKVKMDATADLSTLRRLREAGVARLFVDANASWTPAQCLSLLPRLQDLGVEAVEQPLAPALNSRMPEVLRHSPMPFIADESCATPEDVESLIGFFSGVNIKLVKCGGLTPALKMLEAARGNDLKVMAGCMLESSVLVSAGLALAQKADWADLDGSWLLANDPFTGPVFQDGTIFPSLKPGLGIRLSNQSG
jgi:L-alanine-DL-glutamate epimerase-like enolase superfamily enzyme